MGRIIGIDLGTTNSVVAVMEGGVPIVIPNDEGDRMTPSVVAYSPDGERLVGSIAKRQALLNPEQTIYSIKRFMGRRFAEITEESKFVPYRVVPAQDGDARVAIDGQELYPTAITAQVLLKLKRSAEDYLHEPVTEAVVTVPAYFNDAQRQATKDAGAIAGLEVRRLVNEPTAAAVAYGFDQKQDQTVAVYDFGGGTFDISILAISNGVVRVLATNGDTHLGGDNIDDRIVAWLLEEFRQETGIELSSDKVALQRLKDAAEKVKIELSTTSRRDINLPFLAADANGPRHLVRELTRTRLETMIEDLVDATVTPTLACLADAQLRPTDVDEVVLVGGTTRIPRVQKVVRNLFQKTPNISVNPEEVVAFGAAIQGGILMGDVKDILLLDVTPLSLGIQTRGALMTKIIPRNTSIPVRETRIFTTTTDDATYVDVQVLQGERETGAGNRTLGNFRIEGLAPAPRGVPRIEVTFDIDSNGIVGVTAKDLTTGTVEGIEVQGAVGLSQTEIDAMIFDAQAHREEDQKNRSLVKTIAGAEKFVEQAHRFVEANADNLGQSGNKLHDSIASVLGALQSESDVDRIGGLVERLKRDLYAASSELYGPMPGAPGPAESATTQPAAEVSPVDVPAESTVSPADGPDAGSYSVDGADTVAAAPVVAPARKRTLGELLVAAGSRFTRGQKRPRPPQAVPVETTTAASPAAEGAPTELETPRIE